MAVVPELAAALRGDDSLHRVLSTVAKVTPRRVWVRASAETLRPDVAAQLDVAPSGLGWYVESLNRDTDSDRPVGLTQRWIRSDVVRVVFESALGPTDRSERRPLGRDTSR